jgi:hypothetical protein
VPRFHTAVMLLVMMAGIVQAGDKADRKEEFDEKIGPLLTAIADSKKLVIYEGLPHPQAEPEVLEQELKSKKTITLSKFPFYESPITPTKQLTKQLKTLCKRESTFKFYSGPKFCGGYHPDWCLKFGEGQDAYYVHLCFGCHEAHLIGPNEELMTDLKGAAYLKLVEILKPLRTNRPQPQYEKNPFQPD